MSKRGRPSLETPETKQAIIERIGEGEPLAQICRDANMPCQSAVNNWRRNDAEFDGDFARAREAGHDMIAANIRNVARGLEGSSGDVARDRLIVETDLKLLAKWDKRYSDKVTVQSESTVTHRYDLDSLPDAQLEQLEAILADAARGEGDAGAAESAAVH